MGDQTTGLVLLVVAAGGAYYISTNSNKMAKKVQAAASQPLNARAGNAAESPLVAENIKEASAPTFGGKFGGSRLIERTISTRLAQSWRNSEIPAISRLNYNRPADETLAQIQGTTQRVYQNTMNKTAYIFSPDRQTPAVQGSIRKSYQVPNFL